MNAACSLRPSSFLLRSPPHGGVRGGLSIITTHLTTLIFSACQVLCHAVGILLSHIEERDGVLQVDMTNLHMTLHVLVQELHQLTGEESVFLS